MEIRALPERGASRACEMFNAFPSPAAFESRSFAGSCGTSPKIKIRGKGPLQ